MFTSFHVTLCSVTALTIFSRQKKQTVGKLISATAKALQKVDSIDESEDDLVDEEDQWDDATLPHSIELVRSTVLVLGILM